jgi:hypothetical protein
MILYVNGDSHTAAAEAVSSCCFAEDDGNYISLGRRPHPANLEVSWGLQLAKLLNWEFYCDAESASSNDRIIRTTQEWVRNNYNKLDRVFMVIQWSTWEREEWEYDGQTWQVNASGIDQVPPELQTRYKQFVANVDWKTATQQAHNKIWHFHNSPHSPHDLPLSFRNAGTVKRHGGGVTVSRGAVLSTLSAQQRSAACRVPNSASHIPQKKR